MPALADQDTTFDPLLESTAPTWDLICTMLRPGHSKYVRATLNARMADCGARDLFELVSKEAVAGGQGQLYRNKYYVDAMMDVTLPTPPPLYLNGADGDASWEAGFLDDADGLMYIVGYFDNIAAVEAGYRALVAMPADHVIQVYVNNDGVYRSIVNGALVPPL